MGYRSDVKLILTDKGMEMLRAKVPETIAEERRWEVEPIYEATRICDGKYWLIEWYDIKWYDDWEDYKVPCAVKDFRVELRQLSEQFRFMRVGEDYDDIEEDYSYGDYKEPFPYLTLKREIEVEY